MTTFPDPKRGASILLSFRLQGKTIVIVGSGPLAASRAFAALEADASVVVFSKGGVNTACEELQWRAHRGQLTVLDLTHVPDCPDGLGTIESYLSHNKNVSLVCVTDTILCTGQSTPQARYSWAQSIQRLCAIHGIPVNVTDLPDLCDFSFASTHRFLDPETNEKTALQVGVVTNMKGCRLAGRIKREIVTRLPKEIGLAVEKVGTLRALSKKDVDNYPADTADNENLQDEAASVPNRQTPARARSTFEATVDSDRRRMKWIAQVSEYWPIGRLAKMTPAEMKELLSSSWNENALKEPSTVSPFPSMHSLKINTPLRRGRIILVGSGPGHPSLLTMAAHATLTSKAQLVLSDKLVPADVLALIPDQVDVRIAKKFPGNADGAQRELMEAAVEAANRGLTVLRLKQGDPSVYGRAGEEILYFRSHGFEPLVIPGVSSALAGLTFAGISITQRGVAESFVVCTGVGRNGKGVKLPGYDRGKTVVILMGVARLGTVVSSLLKPEVSPERDGPAYPPHTPIAVIERASLPDQRIIESTLERIESALQCVGDQRPPGMLVIGWTVPALWGKGAINHLDENPEGDAEKATKWLDADTGWRIREGLPDGWQDVDGV